MAVRRDVANLAKVLSGGRKLNQFMLAVTVILLHIAESEEYEDGYEAVTMKGGVPYGGLGHRQ